MLQEVLESGALYSVFQPIVDLSTGRTVAYELLARYPFTHADGRSIGPAELIDRAHAEGRLEQLELHFLGAAVFAISEHARHVDAALHVNLDVRAILGRPPASATAHSLVRLLDACHLDHGAIVVELTETCEDLATPPVLAIIGELRALGLRVALDDVGTGHASLDTALLLRPDLVKLDASLIRDLPRGRRRLARLVERLRNHRIDIVAEGVERASDAEALLAAGVTLAQGYWLGEPSPRPLTPTLARRDRLRALARATLLRTARPHAWAV